MKRNPVKEGCLRRRGAAYCNDSVKAGEALLYGFARHKCLAARRASVEQRVVSVCCARWLLLRVVPEIERLFPDAGGRCGEEPQTGGENLDAGTESHERLSERLSDAECVSRKLHCFLKSLSPVARERAALCSPPEGPQREDVFELKKLEG